MKNKLLVALAFLGLSTTASAQLSDSTETKNHLGIIASPSLDKLFRNNRTLPVGLIYKRQVKPDQAWRISTVGTYNNQIDPEQKQGNNIQNQTSTFISSKTMIGYEWQEKLSNRFKFYYGGDAGVGLIKESNQMIASFSFDNGMSEPVTIQTIHDSDIKSLEFRLQPMIGFQFKIHPKLYVGTESSIILTHSSFNFNSSSTQVYSNEDSPRPTTNESNKRENYKIWYQPLSNIQLVYKF